MRAIVNKILVKTFYQQNAGFFLFLFVLFFGVVAPSQQLAYHYSLIRGMLETPLFLGIVLLAWLFYALKTSRFVLSVLEEPESHFLYSLVALPAGRLFRLFFVIQGWLLLPVWGYSLAVTGVALSSHSYGTALLVQMYMGLICVAGAAGYRFQLLHPGRRFAFLTRRRQRHTLHYWSILLRYLLKEEKALAAGIKLFTCLILYLLLWDQQSADYDLRMPFLFYSLSLFGHGMLLYRCRKLENTRLSFYRTLPVPLTRRFTHYSLFVFLLLLPEMLMLAWMTPHFIRIGDTIEFILSGYSVLLLMNSLLFIAPFTNRAFLQLCLCIFGILYCCVLGNCLIIMSGIFLVTATVLFFRGYARYEMGT